MNETDVAARITQSASNIHAKLGPGLLKDVYEVVLANALSRSGLKVTRQVTVPIRFEYFSFDEGFKVDLLVADQVMVKLESADLLSPQLRPQMNTFLKLANLRLGLLIHFGAQHFENAIVRLENVSPEKKIPLYREPVLTPRR